MAKAQISEAQRELLKSHTVGGDGKGGDEPVTISDSVISNEEFGRLKLVKGRLENVELSLSDFREAVIDHCELTRVLFEDANFSNAYFRATIFTDCIFKIGDFTRARFDGCQFRQCRFDEITVEKAELNDCTFENAQLFVATFKAGKFNACKFNHVLLDNASFYNTNLDSVVFADSECKMSVFSEVNTKKTLFRNGKITDTGFESGTHDGLGFASVDIKGLTLRSVTIDDLSIVQCKDVQGAAIIDGKCTHVTVNDCAMLEELSFTQCELADVNIIKSKLAYFDLVESTLTGKSVFSDLEFLGASFEDSSITGLFIERCVFSDYLVLNGTKFRFLVVRAVKHAADLEIQAKNVEFKDSDKLLH